MKELKIKKQSKFVEFITGKGFYLSLIISLMLIGSTIWFVMNKSIDNVVDNSLDLMKENNLNNNFKSVNNIVRNIPIENEDNQSKNQKAFSDIKDVDKSIETNNNDIKSEENKETENNILFVPPLIGEVVTNFSNNELVKNKTLSDWRTHNGVDIKAPQGTPIKAIADGEVIKIYNDPLLGVCIEIEHPGNINSVYCNLNKNINIKEGDKVEASNIIGSVGETAIGESEIGPHLHLEIKENGTKIDPLSKVKVS